MVEEEKQEEKEKEKEAAGEVEVSGGGAAAKLKALFSVRNIIILAAALIIVPIAAYFLVALVFHPATEKAVTPQKPGEEIKTVYMLEPIIVNISGTNASRYLKVTVGLELNDPLLQGEIEKRNPQILDILVRVFSSRELDEVSQPRGRDGIRREILTRLNDILVTGRLVNVYFTEFVIQ